MADDIKVKEIGLKAPELPKPTTVKKTTLRFDSDEASQKYMKERQAVAMESRGQTNVALRQVADTKMHKQAVQQTVVAKEQMQQFPAIKTPKTYGSYSSLNHS